MAAGFSGVTGISNGGGFDYTYTYCQTFSAESSPLHISSPSVNWDVGAWTAPFQDIGTWRTASSYKALLTAQKNNMPLKTGLAQKMFLLDNWNEYGEGHFLMPTEGLGYRYLDAIREVFGDSSAHTDLTPTLEQKARLNLLYPGPPPVDTIPTDSTDVTLTNWGFESPVVSSLEYTPSGAGWTFTGGSGVQRNGGAFQAAYAPEGVQTGFLQAQCTVSQAVTFAEGSYRVVFKAAKRTSYGGIQSFDVSFDGNIIGTFAPSSGMFVICSTGIFMAAAGEHLITFTGTTSGDNTAFIDAVHIKKAGSTAVSGTGPAIRSMELDAAVPNPFNPSTVISYSVPGISGAGNTWVKLEVVNIQGKLVKTLVNGMKTPGSQSVCWNGTDNVGNRVGSGAYFYRLRCGEKVLQKQMVYLR
ncbi:MAG: FlgD immunoglobulin-like domain containing protein [Fibrobacterota bacterium]